MVRFIYILNLIIQFYEEFSTFTLLSRESLFVFDFYNRTGYLVQKIVEGFQLKNGDG